MDLPCVPDIIFVFLFFSSKFAFVICPEKRWISYSLEMMSTYEPRVTVNDDFIFAVDKLISFYISKLFWQQKVCHFFSRFIFLGNLRFFENFRQLQSQNFFKNFFYFHF